LAEISHEKWEEWGHVGQGRPAACTFVKEFDSENVSHKFESKSLRHWEQVESKESKKCPKETEREREGGRERERGRKREKERAYKCRPWAGGMWSELQSVSHTNTWRCFQTLRGVGCPSLHRDPSETHGCWQATLRKEKKRKNKIWVREWRREREREREREEKPLRAASRWWWSLANKSFRVKFLSFTISSFVFKAMGSDTWMAVNKSKWGEREGMKRKGGREGERERRREREEGRERGRERERKTEKERSVEPRVLKDVWVALWAAFFPLPNFSTSFLFFFWNLFFPIALENKNAYNKKYIYIYSFIFLRNKY
jgi:hypothetical protein